MTLLSILQQVAGEIPVTKPPIIVGSSDTTASLLLACAQAEGEALARRPQDGWVAQIIEYTFPTVVNQGDYALPGDFRRLIDGTLWDRSRFWEMRGSMSPQQWQLYKSSPIGRASLQRRWRIRVPSGSGVGTAPTFSIDPVPTDANSTLVFEYVSNAWCKSATGTAQTSWGADTDVGILDEYLIRLGVKWRMLDRLGMSFDMAQGEYQSMVDKALGSDGGAAIIDMTPSGTTNLLNWANIPETGFG